MQTVSGQRDDHPSSCLRGNWTWLSETAKVWPGDAHRIHRASPSIYTALRKKSRLQVLSGILLRLTKEFTVFRLSFSVTVVFSSGKRQVSVPINAVAVLWKYLLHFFKNHIYVMYMIIIIRLYMWLLVAFRELLQQRYIMCIDTCSYHIVYQYMIYDNAWMKYYILYHLYIVGPDMWYILYYEWYSIYFINRVLEIWWLILCYFILFYFYIMSDTFISQVI